MAGLHPSGSQTCPLGWSPLTVRASIPAARTREVWKSLGAGIRELGVPHTRWLWQPALGNPCIHRKPWNTGWVAAVVCLPVSLHLQPRG